MNLLIPLILCEIDNLAIRRLGRNFVGLESFGLHDIPSRVHL